MFKATFAVGVFLGSLALLAAFTAANPTGEKLNAAEGSAAFEDVGRSGSVQNKERLTVSALPRFSFTDQAKLPFTREDLLGKTTLVHFFFSTCNGPCPGVTSAIGPLLRENPELRIVSISIDPANDTPEVLAGYAKKLAAPEGRWIFLNGPQAQVLALAQFGFGFGIDAESKIHSTSAVLFSKSGDEIGRYQPLEKSSLELLRAAIASSN